ncbi:hypothetical protein CANARDRAFT_194237, partial [[Candida] arabinofermentans NRRL YB-2248]
ENGEFLVVMDDEDRENEGDLIIAAQFVTQEKMAFLVKHSSGYVCVPLSPERADKLELPMMLETQTDRHGTAYTITVDYKEGTTTGISAHDRALTTKQLANPNSKPLDFMRPGHICPLRAKAGLLRERVGHTEAGVQLCKLTNLEPAAAICELVNDDDGLMMRLPQCHSFAEKFNIKLICIKHLIEYMDENNLYGNMNRLFGTKSTQPKASLNDAMNNIDDRVSSLDVKISKLNSELSTYQLKLSKMRDGPGKNTIKQRALKLLKQRKQLEQQKDQLMSQSWNISQAQMTTDNLKNTMITVDALKQSNKELKKTYGKIDIDKLEALQDEMLDMIEQSNELQDSLSRSYDVPDDISESELDAELEALGDELDLNDELTGDSLPSYMLDSSVGDTDKLPNFIDEEQEDHEKEMVAQ